MHIILEKVSTIWIYLPVTSRRCGNPHHTRVPASSTIRPNPEPENRMNIKAMAAGSAAIAGALATVAMATAAVSQAEVHGNRGDRDVVALVLDLRDEGLNLPAEKAARELERGLVAP